MARAKSSDQEALPGMEQPKNPKLERMAKKYRATVALRLDMQNTEKNEKAKLKELMHADPSVRTIEKGGKKLLVYKRADVSVTIEIKEDLKVKLGDEVAAEDDGDADAVEIEGGDDDDDGE